MRLWFGRHSGKDIRDVPDAWHKWFLEQETDSSYDDLKTAIRCHLGLPPKPAPPAPGQAISDDDQKAIVRRFQRIFSIDAKDPQTVLLAIGVLERVLAGMKREYAQATAKVEAAEHR